MLSKKSWGKKKGGKGEREGDGRVFRLLFRSGATDEIALMKIWQREKDTERGEEKRKRRGEEASVVAEMPD